MLWIFWFFSLLYGRSGHQEAILATRGLSKGHLIARKYYYGHAIEIRAEIYWLQEMLETFLYFIPL